MHNNPGGGDRNSGESIRFEYDPDDDDVELGTAVTNAVAVANDVSPEDLRDSLYRTVDPDGLDRLFEPTGDGTPRTGARVELSLAGSTVTIESDGTVTVHP